MLSSESVTVEIQQKKRNYVLLIGGAFSFAFALFQISAIFWTPEMLVYFGGPVTMQAEQPLMYIIVCIAVGLLVSIAGWYAFSGAGVIRRLPLLRTMLTGITGVYMLRGLMIVNDYRLQLAHPELDLSRYLVFSALALCIGIAHLWGTLQVFRIRNLTRIKPDGPADAGVS